MVVLKHLAQRKKVAQGFRHLFAIYAQRTRMHPVIHILAPVGRFTLSDLILVVRKAQVRPAAMNIKCIAEGAFDIHGDRKSTRLNSSHVAISYAVFCLKKKKLIYHIIFWKYET